MITEKLSVSVPPSLQMNDLLNEGHTCKVVSRAFPELQKILLQTQLDITNEDNRDKVGPTVLGIKHIYDILLVFKTKGDLLLSQEPK